MLSHLKYSIIGVLFLCGCTQTEVKHDLGVFGNHGHGGSNTSAASAFDLPDIQRNGELIVLTLYGPTSYFEFKGEDFGNQFKLADAFAKSIGVGVRVDVSRSQNELISKLLAGEGDIIACGIEASDSIGRLVSLCGTDEITHFLDTLSHIQKDKSVAPKGNVAWAVRPGSGMLQSSISKWLAENRQSFVDISTPKIKYRTSHGSTITYSPHRSVSSPIRNLVKGEISYYDTFFKQYAASCGWDWRLLAAQAYQESGFDSDAVSWAGAMGLMQLMPATARSMGVSDPFNAESSVRGATRLIAKLNQHYSSIANPDERINFILAAYNAGSGHVDDARRLAEKRGDNPNVWRSGIDSYVQNFAKSEFYNDPVVKHGYFRGTETYNYVESIRSRWQQYRSKIR